MIGHHQPDLKTNRTAYVSCLKLDSVIGQLKGQLTCHAYEVDITCHVQALLSSILLS